MHMMNILHQCLLLLACVFSFTLCWPFKQRGGPRSRKHGLRQDQDFIPANRDLYSRHHLPLGRRKKSGDNYIYKGHLRKHRPLELFKDDGEDYTYKGHLEKHAPLELFTGFEPYNYEPKSTKPLERWNPEDTYSPNHKRQACEQEDGSVLIPCRSNKSQCLTDDMICDDKVDCDGGEDENPSTCLIRSLVLKWMTEIKQSIRSRKH